MAARLRPWPVALASRWPPSGPPPRTRRRPKRSCKALKAEIDRVAGQVSSDQVENDRLSKELQDRRDCRSSEVRGESRCACAGPRGARQQARGARGGEAQARGGSRPGTRVPGRAAAGGLSDRQRGAAEAAPEPKRPHARRPHVRLLQLFRPGAGRADRPHHPRISPDRAARQRGRRGRSSSSPQLEAQRKRGARASSTAPGPGAALVLASLQTEVAAPAAEPGAHEAPAAAAGKAAARPQARDGALPARHQHGVRPPAGQARLAGVGRLVARFGESACGRREVGWRAGGDRAGRPGAGRLCRAGWCTRTGCRAWGC